MATEEAVSIKKSMMKIMNKRKDNEHEFDIDFVGNYISE